MGGLASGGVHSSPALFSIHALAVVFWCVCVLCVCGHVLGLSYGVFSGHIRACWNALYNVSPCSWPAVPMPTFNPFHTMGIS